MMHCSAIIDIASMKCYTIWYNFTGVILWQLLEMLSNVKNAETLLNPFLYMISKPVPAVPVQLTAGITISNDVQSLWMISPI